MACTFHEQLQDTDFPEIRSGIQLDDQLMFSIELKKRFRGHPLALHKPRLMEWCLSSASIRQIVSAMVTVRRANCAFVDGAFGSSQLPSGLTYIGQLITHDIVSETKPNSDSRVVNGSLNLDSIYSEYKNGDWRGAWPIDEVLDEKGRFHLCIIGKDEFGTHFDFPRTEKDDSGLAVAQIPEQRNDENVLVAQLAIVWMRLHNQIVNELENDQAAQAKDTSLDKLTVREQNYNIARRFCTKLFQSVVIREYLAVLLQKSVYRYYFGSSKSKPLFMDRSREFSVPLEFSHGAFRFSHAMVRQSYNLGYMNTSHSLADLFWKKRRQRPCHRLRWDHFFKPLSWVNGEPQYMPSPVSNFNTASQINLYVAGSLTELPEITDDHTKSTSCAWGHSKGMSFNKLIAWKDCKDLKNRLWQRLANNYALQVHANRSGLTNIVVEDLKASSRVPTAGDIHRSIFSSSNYCTSHPSVRVANFPNRTDYKSETEFKKFEEDIDSDWSDAVIQQRRSLLRGWRTKRLDLDNAPLWLFVLREATVYPEIPGDKLGPLGSLIVAEVLHEAIYSAEISILGNQSESVNDASHLEMLYENLSTNTSMYKIISELTKLEEKNNAYEYTCRLGEPE